MNAPQVIATVPTWQHAGADEYVAFVASRIVDPAAQRAYTSNRARFVRAYPDLQAWSQAPLVERVGHVYKESTRRPTCRVAYRARPYLYYLVLRGSLRLDWAWLVATPKHFVWDLLAGTDLCEGLTQLEHDAARLGYHPSSARQGLRWVASRIFLHTGDTRLRGLTDQQRGELAAAVRAFGDHPDRLRFFGSVPRYRDAVKGYLTNLHLLQVVLYHRGMTALEPRRGHAARPPQPVLKPEMEAVVARYLAARRLNSRPATVERLDVALHHFIAWLALAYPEMDTLAAVTRDQIMEFAAALDAARGKLTGRPLATLTKRGQLAALSVFFRDTAAWGWAGVPGRPLLGIGDLPKIPQRVPRYIPDEELARLMVAVRALPCPYQRAALLIARWSGARREEISRLEIDCLDSYPDGTPRLRIPAGKMKRERLVPLNEEAASAIRALQADRRGERGFCDTQTKVETHYLFMHHGKVFSLCYLFDSPLRAACVAAGLVTADGCHTVTAHRFRHTVGKQLAEKGAKLRTIMTVLGHTSASMSMVYAQISDQEVLKDYQKVLGPGAAIAGPCAETLRSGSLPASAIDWLQSNFFKTELELGHCLRLPQEGPCECELYLTCAKFVTTPEYAPRLRQRRQRELTLIDDAVSHGWLREVERHRCTVARIEHLLADLGVSVEDPEMPT